MTDTDKLKRIKAIAFDIDGVMTDGMMLALPDGDLLRSFNAKDCFGLRMAKMNGLITCVITGASTESIKKRMMSCGVDEEDIYLHSRIKLEDFEDLCRRHSLSPDEVMYFGDDLPDIGVLRACGIGVATADAVQEVKDVSDYISPLKGGQGCIRHAIEMVMKTQGIWHLDDVTYKKLY